MLRVSSWSKFPHVIKSICLWGSVHINPGVMIAPGQALPRVHMMICTLPRGKFSVIWSLWIHLNSFSFHTNCYREWILNRFTYFWCFLELFIGKFILNINNEHAQDFSCPGGNCCVLFTRRKITSARRVTRCLQRVTRLSKLTRGNEKLMFRGVRPCTEAKLTPGLVSCPGIMWTGP